MSNLGMGVMIRMLGGRQKGETITPFIGKTIAAVTLDSTASARVDALYLTFGDGETAKIYDAGQSCCEHRYMHTDDDLAQFVGATLTGAEVRDAPDVEDRYGEHEVQFLVVTTSLGEFAVETHNEHNGYYGGFWMVAERMENSF